MSLRSRAAHWLLPKLRFNPRSIQLEPDVTIISTADGLHIQTRDHQLCIKLPPGASVSAITPPPASIAAE